MKGHNRTAGRQAWAEIRLDALAHNLRAIRRHTGGRKVLAVVKADAYGHGAVPVTKSLARAGADCFGVTSTDEGAELRESGVRKPIVVLTGFWPGEEKRILRTGLTPSVTAVEQLPHLERAARAILRNGNNSRVKKHAAGAIGFQLKVDTGMNRLGVPVDEIDRFLAALADFRHLRMEGTFTHFSASEDFESRETEEQEKRFAGVLAKLRAAGVDPGVVHMANSAATASRPGTWAQMVRPGALLYGYHQFYNPPERESRAKQALQLQPVLSLRARVLSVKDVPANTGVGYNGQYVTQRASRIAVLAAGYAEGLVRQLSNRGSVILHGRCAPLVGTISMDLAMVDVTDLPQVRAGDVATIFGSAGTACARFASDVARELGTVTADLLCAVGRRVPRIYLRN